VSRPAQKSILKANGRRNIVGSGEINKRDQRITLMQVRPFSVSSVQRRSAKATSSAGHRPSARRSDDDRIRREVEQDLEHID